MNTRFAISMMKLISISVTRSPGRSILLHWVVRITSRRPAVACSTTTAMKFLERMGTSILVVQRSFQESRRCSIGPRSKKKSWSPTGPKNSVDSRTKVARTLATTTNKTASFLPRRWNRRTLAGHRAVRELPLPWDSPTRMYSRRFRVRNQQNSRFLPRQMIPKQTLQSAT